MRAGGGLREAPVTASLERLPAVRSPALEIFAWSRLAVWAAAAFAYLWWEPKPAALAAQWDAEVLHDAGWLVDIFARWDSAWFLRVAEDGYGSAPDQAAAFFPLYPALVGAAGRALGGHFVVAGVIVSLAAAAGAFVLLWRLGERKIGPDGARRALLYLALFPTSIFLQAVYSESLFLLLAVAAFVLAERGRWAGAAGVTALAILTRPVGVILVPCLALLAWRTEHRRSAVGWLAASPIALVPFALLLHRQAGDAFAFARAQDAWHRELSPLGPLGGVWDGARAAWAGVRQIAAGADGRVYWEATRDAEPLHAAIVNVSAFAYLVLFALLAVAAWRLLGAPYGLFAALSLAVPLSVPSERWPLLSLPRFGLVAFPLFLALAVVGRRPRAHVAILGASAIFLGVTVVQWVQWQWVS